MKRIALLYYFLFFSFFVSAQDQSISGKLSSYTKYFLTSIKQTDISSIQKKALYKSVIARQSDSQEYVNTFIYLAENADAEVLEQEDIKIKTRTGDIVTALVPIDMLETIAALPEVKYVQIGTPVHKRMDKARVASYVDKVQTGTTPLSGPFFGKDVVVGIIDNGFEYGHPNFYNADQSAFRIKRVWDQNAETGTAPSGFDYGKEYINQDAILTAAYDMRNESHGTHVTGIAVGADQSNKNTYYGIAGEADIVLVSYRGSDVDIVDGINYIYDYATSVGKPCVINMSLGSHVGPHDGTSSFDQLTNELQGKGRLLVGAAGNEGNSHIHASKSFTPSDTILKTFFSFTDNIACDIWGETEKDYKVQVCVYDSINMKTVYTSSEYNSASTINNERIRLSTLTNGASGSIYLYTGIDALNNKPNIYIYSELNSIKAGNCLELIIKATEGTVHAWSDDSQCSFTNNNQSGWYDGDNDYSTGEIGGTGKQIVSVGAYTSKTIFTNLQNATYITPSETLSTIASFSSMGPTVDGRMKPEITAPGTYIASSVSSYDTTDPTQRVKSTTMNGHTYYYGMMAGTSMAAPYVTGVLATWLQADPDLTPEKVKSIFQQTAINDTYTGAILPDGNNTWGYGKINAFAGIVEVIEKSTGIEEISNIAEKILMYTTSGNKQLINFLFTQGDSNVQINVFNVNGQKILSKHFDEVSNKQEEIISLEGLSKGLYLIRISGNKLNQTFKVIN